MRKVSRMVAAAVLAAAAMGATASAASADGRLVQLADPFDCIAEADPACAGGSNLNGLRVQAISADGRHLYAVSQLANAVLTFDRDPATGRVTQRAECISDAGGAGCADGEALQGPRDLVISPDGGSVYVASGSGVAVLDRNPTTGTLTQKAGTDGCASAAGGACETALGLGTPRSIAISPDGTSVYVGATTSQAVVVFDRAAGGLLEQKAGTNGCVSGSALAGCSTGVFLNDIRSLVVSSDGQHVYAAARTSQTVVHFERAPSGTINQVDCVQQGGSAICDAGTMLHRPNALAVSPDGKDLYVASWTAGADPTGVAVLDIDPASGTLSQPPAPSTAGCVAQIGSPADPACSGAVGLFAAADIAVSGDGRNVYVATQNGAAVFDRLASGALSQRTMPEGCLNDSSMTPGAWNAGCATATSVLAAENLVISPEGDNVYISSPIPSSLAAFDRDASPVCRDVRRTAHNATAREIPLDCVDPNGDALAYAVVAGPANGSLGAAAATMTYTPAAGFVGIDTFTVQATGNGAASNVATVTVEVLPPAGGATATTRTLLIASLKTDRLRKARGRAFSAAFVATTPGTATLEVLDKRGKRKLSATATAIAGDNAIRIGKRQAKRLKAGRYSLRLTVQSGDGQVSADVGKLVIKR